MNPTPNIAPIHHYTANMTVPTTDLMRLLDVLRPTALVAAIECIDASGTHVFTYHADPPLQMTDGQLPPMVITHPGRKYGPCIGDTLRFLDPDGNELFSATAERLVKNPEPRPLP